MTPVRTALILRNPAARGAPARDRLAAAARTMAPLGWDVRVLDTASQQALVAAVHEAVADGYDALLACGGDGTLNVVLNAVCTVPAVREHGGDGPAVGLVPSGTGNVWAREAGVPLRIEDAVAMLVHGRPRRVDLGVAQIGGEPPRRFLLMCGLGLDATVVQRVEQRPRLKRLAGRSAFVAPALAAIGQSRSVETAIDVDGVTETLPLRQAIAGNSRLYGGLARIADGARLDDGLLDLVTFAAPGGVLGAARSAALVAGVVRGRLSTTRREGIRYQRGARMTLHPASPLPVQVDGDPLGSAGPDAPLHLSVEHAAATLLTGDRADVLFAEA